MKKVFALLMVLVLACALCVPALAAGQSYTKQQLLDMADKAPADVKDIAKQVINGLEGSLTVDVDQVKGIYNNLKTTLATEKDAGKIKTAIENAASDMEKATGLKADKVSVSVDAVTGKVSVTAEVSKDGKTVASVQGTGTAPMIKKPDSSGSSNTTSNTAAAAASVIKATGFDASAVVMVVLAIAGVLGVATVKARKLD